MYESLMKRKKHERRLDEVVGTMNTVKFHLERLQTAQLDEQVATAMQTGAREQKKAQQYL